MSKQASAEDDPTCIRKINSDVIGFSWKVKNIKTDTDIAWDYFFLKVNIISSGQTSFLQVISEFYREGAELIRYRTTTTTLYSLLYKLKQICIKDKRTKIVYNY